MTAAWKKALALTLVLSMLLSLGVASADSTGVVTGHTTYVDMSATGFDKCLAGLVGVVNQRVTWFNGQTLFQRSASGSGLWVYATEDLEPDVLETLGVTNEPDPSEEPLLPTGKVYRFYDPTRNENTPDPILWEVHEFQQLDPVVWSDVFDWTSQNATDHVLRHVYAVRISDETLHDQVVVGATGLPYNFVSMVDTCKFRSDREKRVTHDASDNDGWQPANGNANCPKAHGECTAVSHEPDTDTHHHDMYNVDLYVGPEPTVVQLDTGSSYSLTGGEEGGSL